MKTVKRSKIVGKAHFLLTFVPVLIAQAMLCLAEMLGAAIRQASLKSPEELRKNSIGKDCVKKRILHQQFLLMSHLQLR